MGICCTIYKNLKLLIFIRNKKKGNHQPFTLMLKQHFLMFVLFSIWFAYILFL